MSISGALKTTADSIYAYRFVKLLQKDFVDWDAYKLGLINATGNVIKRPKTPEEKSAYTPFHGAIRALKKQLSYVPFANTFTVINTSLSAIGSRFSLTESDLSYIRTELKLESELAGDPSADPEQAAAGVTSGSITNGIFNRKNKFTKKKK